MLQVASIVFPIFAIVLAGFLYGRANKPDMRFANQLNMDIFVPALVFSALASKSFDLMTHWPLALGALSVVLLSGLIALPVARWLKVAPATFVPPMMFTNSGNMGLPLALLAFGENAMPAAIVMFMVENTLHYSLGTWLLDKNTALHQLWRVPVIAASIAGLLVSLSSLTLWSPLLFSIKLLGDVSIPLLLFSLGVRLTQSALVNLKVALVGAVLCPLSGLLVAWPLTVLLGLSDQQSAMLIVFGALPPAVLNFVFAEKYAQAPVTVASIVMVGNLGSLLFIPAVLYFTLKQAGG